MLKKLIALGLVVGIALTGTGVVNAEVVASPTSVETTQELSPEAAAIVKESNEKVDSLIKKAQMDAKAIEGNKKYEKELDKIIIKLQKNAEKITKKGIHELAKLGVQAECVYVEVQIGNRIVKVDPIKVIF